MGCYLLSGAALPALGADLVDVVGRGGLVRLAVAAGEVADRRGRFRGPAGLELRVVRDRVGDGLVELLGEVRRRPGRGP
jgi:hypothetical protein